MPAKQKVIQMPGGEKTGLQHYDTMRRELALCCTVDEVKEVKDRARAAEIYKRQIHDTEAERQLAQIRIRAERRLGELLKEMADKGERQTRGQAGKIKKSPESILSPKLSDLGISKDESSKYQKLANIPEEDFEQVISEPDVIPTTKGVLAASQSFTVQTRVNRIRYDIGDYIKPKPAVIEGQLSGEDDPERVARKICDNVEALNKTLALMNKSERIAAFGSSYGPILYVSLQWLEQTTKSFLALGKKPSKKEIRAARKLHPEYGE